MTLNALRFFPRQLRDTLLTRGAAMLVIATLLLLPPLLTDFSGRPVAPDWKQILGRTLEESTLFLTLVATYGIIGEDVRRGYFRLVFSKPVSPVWYYLQAFVAAWLALLAVQFVSVAVFAAVREPVWPAKSIVLSWQQFLIVGAIVFALSRVTRLDWLLGVLLVILGTTLRGAYPPSESLRGKVLNVLLPPVHLFQSGAFPEGPDLAHTAWLTGYALLAIAVGLVLVRTVPFGTERT